jgi:hypothetical protein
VGLHRCVAGRGTGKLENTAAAFVSSLKAGTSDVGVTAGPPTTEEALVEATKNVVNEIDHEMAESPAVDADFEDPVTRGFYALAKTVRIVAG